MGGNQSTTPAGKSRSLKRKNTESQHASASSRGRPSKKLRKQLEHHWICEYMFVII